MKQKIIINRVTNKIEFISSQKLKQSKKELEVKNDHCGCNKRT
ncbi:hypothetical protein [Clostridium botulinum]|nr:hypothetical protein [Clostridium botulinum]